MTEEDTFRILKRISHSEMMSIWKDSPEFSIPTDREAIIRLFKKYGWSLEEYTRISIGKYYYND